MLKKKRNKGFTLVELLVVMAIIAILAAIVVPNLATWIGRGRVTRAISEIESIELALSAMLADTERSSLNDLFNPAGVEAELNQVSLVPTPDRWKRAQEIYTRATYALLRDGRGVINQSDSSGFLYAGDIKDSSGAVVQSDAGVLRQNLVKKLGVNYLPEIGFDPFGQLYNIFPGPWNFKDGPIIFRIYQQSSGSGGQTLPGKSQSVAVDALTVGEDPTNTAEVVIDQETGATLNVSFPATTRKAFYIWSSGANTLSSQAVYDPGTNPGGTGNVQYIATTSNLYYDPQLEPSQIGGGDDINNWDAGSSWQSFYN